MAGNKWSLMTREVFHLWQNIEYRIYDIYGPSRGRGTTSYLRVINFCYHPRPWLHSCVNLYLASISLVLYASVYTHVRLYWIFLLLYTDWPLVSIVQCIPNPSRGLMDHFRGIIRSTTARRIILPFDVAVIGADNFIEP